MATDTASPTRKLNSLQCRPAVRRRQGPEDLNSPQAAATRCRMRRMHYETIRQMKKQLGQLDKWLETAATYAQTKGFDPKVYASLRLAPDQFAFARKSKPPVTRRSWARRGSPAKKHPRN